MHACIRRSREWRSAFGFFTVISLHSTVVMLMVVVLVLAVAMMLMAVVVVGIRTRCTAHIMCTDRALNVRARACNPHVAKQWQAAAAATSTSRSCVLQRN